MITSTLAVIGSIVLPFAILATFMLCLRGIEWLADKLGF